MLAALTQGAACIWDGSQRHTTVKAGVLTLFTGGQEVLALQAAQADGERILGNVAKGLPLLAQAQTGRFFLTDWHRDADIGGGYTNFAPGQYLKFSEFMYVEAEDPEEANNVHFDNLVFAGEQFSDEYYGYMNGGAQTGRLAAAVVVNLINKG